MIDAATVRRIAAALPGAEDVSSAHVLSFRVAGKLFAWTWLERVEPKGPRRPRLDVLAVRCAAEQKEAILAADPDRYVIDDHYRGFPAVVVRLDLVDEAELEGLLKAAWRCQAPASLRRAVVQAG